MSAPHHRRPDGRPSSASAVLPLFASVGLPWVVLLDVRPTSSVTDGAEASWTR